MQTVPGLRSKFALALASVGHDDRQHRCRWATALTLAVARTAYGSGNTGWSPTPVTRFVHQAFVGSGGRKEPHSAVGAVLCWVLEAKVGSLLGRMLPPSILAWKPGFGGGRRAARRRGTAAQGLLQRQGERWARPWGAPVPCGSFWAEYAMLGPPDAWPCMHVCAAPQRVQLKRCLGRAIESARSYDAFLA